MTIFTFVHIFFILLKVFFTILISNFARRCKAMQEGKNLRNAITMRGGSGRAVVPWCQVAGSPSPAAAAVPAKVAEVASNWSSSQLVRWPGHRRSWAQLPRCPRPSRPARHGTISSLRRPRESVKAQHGGHTTASWCQPFENRKDFSDRMTIVQ